MDSRYSSPTPSLLGLYFQRNTKVQYIKLGHSNLTRDNGITYYEYLGNASDTEWGKDNLKYLNLGADIITINGDTSKTSDGHDSGDTPQRYAGVLYNNSTHELTISNHLRTLKPTGNVDMTPEPYSQYIYNRLNGDYAPSGIIAYFSPQGCLLNGPLYDGSVSTRHTSTVQVKDGEVVIQARKSGLDNTNLPATLRISDNNHDADISLQVYTGTPSTDNTHNFISVTRTGIKLNCDRYVRGSYEFDDSGVAVRLNDNGISLNGEVYLHHINDSLAINTGSIGALTATQEESDYISENTLQSIILDLKRSCKSRYDNLITSEYYVKHSETENGITMTLNDDGSLTFTGTATAETYFIIVRGLPKNVWQNEYYSGNFKNASATTKYLRIGAYDIDKEYTWVIERYIANTPQLLNPSSTDYALDVYAHFKSGTSVDETIYPMISSEQYTTWAPISLNLNERLYALEQQLLQINNSLA